MSTPELSADELTLPIKRTDGDTIEERLTGNAYHNILPARYLKKDADGNLAEDQEDLFERVAENIALAEAVYEAEKRGVEITVTPDQVKPEHPRRDELAEEVFGAGTTAEADVETPLTEHNVNKFAYETVVPELPVGVREHVEEVAGEFQEMMERLSFMPNCVPPDSLVASGGGLKPLTDIEPGERVYDDEDGDARVESKFENGEKRVVELETATGYSVRATPEHYFRVITSSGEYEWRQVKEIDPDDVLAVQKNFLDDDGAPSELNPIGLTDGGAAVDGPTTNSVGRSRGEFNAPDTMTPELAEWLGLYVGDGTARESGVRVAFDERDANAFEQWASLTESVFGFEPTSRTRTDAECTIGQAYRRDLYAFLEANDLLKQTSKTATVPGPVLESGRACISNFLRGLFEADGTVGKRAIELYTHSKPLARQVQKLLLGLGIRSKLREKDDGYRVGIRKNVCGKRFVERVGFISDRKRTDAERFAAVAANATSIKIPNQTERLHEWFQESDLGHDAYRDLSQFLISPDSEYHQEISKRMFRKYAEKYPELWDSPVAEFVQRDQFYETVSEIRDVGTTAVEDMQVPRRNTYVVDGFVSHNSPTLMNAGDELQQLSACFVDSPEDDLTDIHQTAKEAAEVFQCLTEDATVHLDGEGIVSVADVEPGDKIRQRDGDEYRTRTVEETHAYQDAPVDRVVTTAGVELTGTPNHELLVNDEWRRIDEIDAGDTLSIRLGWIEDEDEMEPLETTATGGQWGTNRGVSNDDIISLYSEGYSDYEIAERLDCSASTVQRRRSNELDLPPNGSGGRDKGSVSFDTATFDRLYEAGRSDREIAAQLDVHQTTVGQYRASKSLEPNGEPAKTVTQPTTLTPDLAELLGMWVGDGSKHEDGIRFHLNREESLEHADRLCRHLFDEGLDWRFEDGCYDAVLHSHEIRRFWLANFGDAKPDAPSASVPEQLRRADHETITAFLRGLFSTDGGLQKGRYPRLWSASESLIDGVQQLLLGIGIPAARWELDSENRDYYNLGPTGELGLTGFAERVGFVDTRDDELAESLEDATFRGTTFGEIRDESTWAVPVERVEDAGTDTVYDVTVEGDHEYLADSVVSHNSGGGMGYAFWRLRPYGDAVGSTGGIASGPITFMETFDQMCFTPGTDILTSEGNVPIEDLEVGQAVIDENGDERQVTDTMERSVDEEIFEVTPKRINKPLRMTGEHPLKVAREDGFEWVDASDLREGDFLVLGHATDSNSLGLDEMIDLTGIASGPVVASDGGITVNREYYGSTKGPSPQSMATEVPVSDFATIAGWYLAEGCVVYRRGIPNEVTFTLHADEQDAAEEIINALDSFAAPTRIETVDERNTLHVHVESASFAQFVEGVFGTGASEKRVPSILRKAPPRTQARVLEALFDGDGRLQKRGKSQRVQLKLANEDIIDFVFQAGLRCGVQFSRHEREPTDRKPTYQVSVSVSTAMGTPLSCLFEELPDGFRATDRTKQIAGREVVAVDEIDTVEYEGPVYNAEVEGTHTYVAEDVVVHNCETIAQGGARRGAQMAIMRVSHPDVIEFIHSKRKDVSLAHQLKLNDPDDFTYTTFSEALEESRELIDEDGKVPEHLRNAVEGHLSNFNISVGVTDGFMEALQNGEEYTFTNPRTGEPHVASEETEEMYSRYDLGEYVEPGEELSIPAEVLWERIVAGAHENGEPGVVYLDRINDEHSFPVESTPTGDGSKYEILATNPCVAEGTLVNTPGGYRPVEDIHVGDEISTVIGCEAVDEIETHSDYPVHRVEFSDGGSLEVTAQHRFHVLRDDKQIEKIPLHEVKEGDHVRLHPSELEEKGTDEQYERELKRGILLGDGCYTDATVDRNHVHISTSVEDEGYNERVKELFGREHFRADDPHSEGKAKKMVFSDGGAVVQQLDLDTAKAPGKSFDPTNLTTESEAMGILDGLLASDGNINLYSNHPQIRWDTSSEDLADSIRNALLGVGIHGRISVITDPKRGGSINGRKISANNPKYTVNVSGASARRYAEKSRIGEIHPEKGEQMFELRTEWMTTGNTWKAQIESIEELEETTTVYDLYCSESDTWITEGYVQQGCGEQPLMEYEACNLGHINLSTVADTNAPDWRVWSDRNRDEYDSLEDAVDAFLADAIDREEFDHRIEWGTRFLENVVTMSNFPVEKIEETVRNNRKVGLGIMGLAQLYIQLGVAYGSEVANEIARQLMVDINHGSKWTSHELADDRDSFANWADSKYANPTEYADWFERMTGLDAEEWGEGFPIRNHNTTTIAPTGCVEENSLVSTDEGLVPIKDLDETTAEFEQWNEIEVGVSTDGGTKAATAVYDNGFADVRRIETEGGFSVASTPDHRFRTITDDGEYVWQEAAEFESGDRILLQRGTFDSGSRATLDTSERRNYHWNSDEQLELPSEMTPELAEFLGYFMGDGYVHEDVGVKLVVESDAQGLDAYLRKLGESVFGVSPTVEDRDTRHVLVFGGRHLPRYFEDNGWKKADGNEGEGAASAFVPDEVLQGNEAVAKAFLRGLFEADGTASRKVELSTVSETLADQVQTLLLALGCVFVRDTLETADRNDHYGDRPRHSVRGANKREDQRFLEEVGFITKSTEFDLTPQSHKNDTYPPAVVDSLRDVSGYDSVSEPVKNRVNQSPINGSVSRKLVRDIEEETGETVRIDGRPLVDFYAATVGSVTEETAYTKDISVPSNNTYVANGFVTHNTTSMVGNTSGGCEPIYNVAYYKNVSDDVQGDEMLVEFDDYFLRVLEDNDIPIEDVKEEAKEQMATNSFDGVDGLTTVPDAIGELFVTTSDLSAKGHASVQCACQVGVDSAISKTTNAPNDSTVEDAKEVFEYIYEHGGKGVTYYRDGTRSKQVLTTRAQNTEFSDMDEDEATEALLERVEDVFGGMEEFLAREDVRGAIEADVAEIFDIDVDAGVDYSEKRPRPDVLHGVTQRIETGYGKLYVNINEDERGQPFELFATIGNSGGFTNSFTEALAKTVSTALRSGVDPEEIADELQGIRSPKVAWDKGEQIQSIPDAVGTAMRRYLDGDIDPAYPQQRTLEETAEDDGASETVEEREARTNLEEAEANAEPDGGVQAAPAGDTASDDASQSLIDAGESPECPECGSMSLHFSEGCKTCEACGWSEC